MPEGFKPVTLHFMLARWIYKFPSSLNDHFLKRGWSYLRYLNHIWNRVRTDKYFVICIKKYTFKPKSRVVIIETSYWISVKFNKVAVWVSKYSWMWIINGTRTTSTGYIIPTRSKIELIRQLFVDPNTRSNNKYLSSSLGDDDHSDKNGLRPFEHSDRGFESHSRHGCLCAINLYLCCSVCR
jgi:hypothetical protein